MTLAEQAHGDQNTHQNRLVPAPQSHRAWLIAKTTIKVVPKSREQELHVVLGKIT